MAANPNQGRRRAILVHSGWRWAGMGVAFLTLAPVLSIFVLALGDGASLSAQALLRYLGNSLILMAGAGLLACGIGTLTAWLVATRDFPLRRLAEAALLLPLAFPAYAAAYALADFTDYAGPLQSTLRGLFDWQSAADYAFPDFRSLSGAILVFGLSFYPYVHLLTRAAFADRSAHAANVARSLGLGPAGVFWRVDLPLARPALIAGTAIVMMEVLADFGAVEHFGVQTLTTGVFAVWTAGNNPGGAARVAGVILLVVAALVLAERRGRARQRFHTLARRTAGPPRARLTGSAAALALTFCLLPPLLGFALPALVLGAHVLAADQIQAGLWQAAANSLLLAALAAFAAAAAAVTLALALREGRGILHAVAALTSLGYAAPGAVLALGVLVPLAALDHLLADAVTAITGTDPGLLLTGSLAGLVFACSLRFFALADGPTTAAFARITARMDMAARTLGATPGEVLAHVHWPVIRSSVLAGGALVFVDCVKELPATLMLRPFGFETLATFAYYRASAEDIAGAAPAVLLIAGAGLGPVLALALSGFGERERVSDG